MARAQYKPRWFLVEIEGGRHYVEHGAIAQLVTESLPATVTVLKEFTSGELDAELRAKVAA